jgi:raffinose/stachyose/melibiose transport system permease protein
MANKSLSMTNSTFTITRKPLTSRRVVDVLVLICLIIFLVIMLLPLVMITINSFKTEPEYYANGPFALPQNLNLDGIVATWQSTDYTTKLINSTVISLSTAILATLLSLFNAYALGIGRVKGKAVLTVFFLLAITLPVESVIYPLYYFFKLIHLYDTQLSVILVTAAFHSAYGTYLLSSVFSVFPRELMEAALIDGCNKIQMLLRIIVPISWSALSLLFVFFFIWTWNDFFLPLIFLISNSKQTVPLAIAAAQGEHNMVVTTQSAAALLGIVPCIIFFLLFQRTITRGVLAGSIK